RLRGGPVPAVGSHLRRPRPPPGRGRSALPRTGAARTRQERGGAAGNGAHMCLAVPGKVTSIWEQDDTPMGQVDFGGVTKEVCLAYVPDLQVGEYTIVHVGFALQRLDEQSALETLALFREMGELDKEF